MRTTTQKQLLEIGEACEKYHDAHVRNLTTKKLQVDEIWSFVYAKEKNVPIAMKGQGAEAFELGLPLTRIPN